MTVQLSIPVVVWMERLRTVNQEYVVHYGYKHVLIKKWNIYMTSLKVEKLQKNTKKLLNGVAALESIATADACTLSVKEDRKVSLSEITNA